MNTEVKQFLDEAASQGRIRAMLDAVVVGLGKGLKRSAPERRALWEHIAEEATRCRDGIPSGIKSRAPKAAKPNGTPTILSRTTPAGIPGQES